MPGPPVDVGGEPHTIRITVGGVTIRFAPDEGKVFKTIRVIDSTKPPEEQERLNEPLSQNWFVKIE